MISYVLGNFTIRFENTDLLVNSPVPKLSRRSILRLRLNRYETVSDAGKIKKDYLTSYGHITLDIPDPIRTLKSSRVEPT